MNFLFKHIPSSSNHNWTLHLGPVTRADAEVQLNKLYLFKGISSLYTIPVSTDTVSTENFNTGCTKEMIGTRHMVCLTCSDEVHGIQPEKIACLASGNIGTLNFGPAKGGDLDPNLRIFCPEGNQYLPTSGGISGTCDACSNLNCSRCGLEDAGKCIGCSSPSTLSVGEDCLSTNCATSEFLNTGKGNQCTLFSLDGCTQPDSFGWCNKSSGVGCPVGSTYQNGVCCPSPVNMLNLDTRTYPARCFKCHSSCFTCSGSTALECTSCSKLSALCLEANECKACLVNGCIKCDLDPTSCELCGPNFTLQDSSTCSPVSSPNLVLNTTTSPHTNEICTDNC